eukprot:Phypoly_transcript_12291.p1 GENE.Phypoly_transcript_12291~~Phypoly_transcript_12291.p1  ORF type:complete len:204 (+),score=22.08 Phypoly_transcript_12291:153-764(+)
MEQNSQHKDSHSLKVAIFGSTGGSGKAAVEEMLKAGHQVTALVRSPAKLLQVLGLAECPSNLSIIQGDIREVHKIKEAIDAQDVIVSTVGGQMSFSNPLHPTLSDKTICHDAIKCIIEALGKVEKPPNRLIALSTTGIDEARDVPLLMLPLYHWLLSEPHQDKINMEKAIVDAGKHGVIKEWVIIRPAFLTDGPKTEQYRAVS